MSRFAAEKLAELRVEALQLGARIVESIPRTTNILLEQDLEGAEYQILSDDEFDARTLDLEENSIVLMALQAPVATDLRRALVIMKLSAELERTADLVANLCKVSRRIHGQILDERLQVLIRVMGDHSRQQMQVAVEAYANEDAALAASVRTLDERLDDLQRKFIQTIFECSADSSLELSVAIQMAITARFYERIGDHAVNIADLVEFLVTGSKPPSRPRLLDGPTPTPAGGQ
ncbi:MAG: phosphate signaling complex protein PhoU [Actinobacteria bacterium]|nr:phosphate signaling complex protein PhoU [Actinomycetota bacterium]